jgi:hypothetical protein
MERKNRLGVFGNGILQRVGSEMGKMAGGWRKLHNEEIHNLNSLLTIGMIRSGRKRWALHVARMRR